MRHVHIVDQLFAFRSADGRTWGQIAGNAHLADSVVRLSVHTLGAGGTEHNAFRRLAVDEGTVHHEFAHLITQKINGYEWMRLHPGVAYVGRIKREATDKQTAHFAHEYGRTDYQEDIATIVEAMFDRRSGIWRRIKTDKILAAKVAFLKQWYANETKGMSFEINDAYWKKFQPKSLIERIMTRSKV